MNQRHTPEPWLEPKRYTVNGNPDMYEIPWSEDGELVAEGVYGEANAKHIVHAVNTLPKLVEALEEAESALNGIKSKMQSLSFSHPENWGIHLQVMAENVDRGLKALALAKGSDADE